MSDDDRDRLQPHFEPFHLAVGETLADIGQPIRDIYFLERGAISMFAPARNQRLAHLVMVGCEGLAPLAMVLGSRESYYKSVATLGPVAGCRLDAVRFRAVMEESKTFLDLMLRFIQTVLLQVSQNVTMVTSYKIKERLSSRLLMCHDRVEGDTIEITHDLLALMTSSTRARITHTLHILEGEGAIRAVRGSIAVKDRAKLVELAQGAYGAAEAAYRTKIGPFGKSPG